MLVTTARIFKWLCCKIIGTWNIIHFGWKFATIGFCNRIRKFHNWLEIQHFKYTFKIQHFLSVLFGNTNTKPKLTLRRTGFWIHWWEVSTTNDKGIRGSRSWNVTVSNHSHSQFSVFIIHLWMKRKSSRMHCGRTQGNDNEEQY